MCMKQEFQIKIKLLYYRVYNHDHNAYILLKAYFPKYHKTKPGVLKEAVESNKRLLSEASATKNTNVNKSRKIKNSAQFLSDNQEAGNNNADTDVVTVEEILHDYPFVNENTSDTIVQLNEGLNATKLGTSSSESDR